MSLQRKLTLAGLVGKIDLRALMAAPGEKMDLAIIRGIARRYKPDQTALGDFVRFFGQFRGTNMITGEIQDAPQMIAPPTIQDMLYGAIGSEGEKEVAFAFKIGCRFDNEAITKYVYEFEPLMSLAENDPITRMDRDLEPLLAALPKPQQAALPAPAALVNDPTKTPAPSQADTTAQAEADQKEKDAATARVNQRASGGRRR